MKYLISTTELQQVDSWPPQERLQYFLGRAIESEEVWGLSNPSGWVMKDVDNKSILPVWPYEQMASLCAANEWQDYTASAVSLEHFVYKLLPIMVDQDIRVEILPTSSSGGECMDASELASIFDSLLETGEYYMEG